MPADFMMVMGEGGVEEGGMEGEGGRRRKRQMNKRTYEKVLNAGSCGQ
jgi:hypothetical protein